MTSPSLHGSNIAQSRADRDFSKHARRDLKSALRIGFRGYFRRLAFAGMLSVLSAMAETTAVALFIPLVAAVGTEEHAFTGTVPIVGQTITLGTATLLWLCLIAVLARLFLQGCVALAVSRLTTTYEADKRRLMIGSFMETSWSIQAQEGVGRLQSLMSDSIGQARGALKASAQLMVSLGNFCILLLAALVANALAALAIVGAAGILFLTIRPISAWARHLALKKASLNISLAQALNEAVGMAREIRVFGAAASVRAHIEGQIETVRRNRFVAEFLGNSVPVVYQNAAGIIVIVGLGLSTSSGAQELTSLGIVATLLLRALSYSQAFQSTLHQVVERVPYLQQMQDLHAEFDDVPPSGRQKGIASIHHIAFKGVHFAYAPGVEVLRGVEFSVERGEAVAIVGPSGAGKSTLLQLLLRLREPTAGSVLVNGEDAALYSQESWLSRVSFVPQEPRLLTSSVAANIRFYRDDISDAEVATAARMAHVHDDIMRLPRAYDDSPGPRGEGLSGGQRQRICIARALARVPDVLILDEPTSSLDVHSEALIQEALLALKGRATLFVVAHRLSTLSICDKVMVLRHGVVASMGTPSEMAKGDSYYREALKLAQVR